MLLRVSEPTLVPELVRVLERRAHYVVQQQASGHVAVSVLGSFADGGELELALFVGAWQAAHPDVTVELLDS